MIVRRSEPRPEGAFIKPGQGPGLPGFGSRLARLALFTLAVFGAIAGLAVLWIHLTSDPLADARAYYDAARRLNEGQPLYAAQGGPTTPTFYFYPPLLAIVLRPLALLPFHVFALLWESVVVAAFIALVRRLGVLRGDTWIALGLLGVPIGWALAIAQAQVPMVLLLAIGQPWSIALATNLKIFPVLVVVWWFGRRQFGAIAALVAWLVVLALAQWLIEPSGSVAFFSAVGLDQTEGVRNLSPYAISPWLWAGLGAVGAIATLYLAPSRWGWPAAVALATLASPRLLLYMLMGLLAALREPDPPQEPESEVA